MPQTTYCPRHRKTETALRCGKCGTPVCPRCVVHTPVGMRCPDCAQLRRLPTFDVSLPVLARSAAAGLGVAVAAGLAFVFLSPLLLRLPFLDFIALVAAGYAVGEAVSAASNRRRGRALRWTAALCVLVTFVVIVTLIRGLLGVGAISYLLALAFSIYVAVNRV